MSSPDPAAASRRLILALLICASALGSCQSQESRPWWEGARDNDVRCLASEPDMTVFSPSGPKYTADLIDDLRKNISAISEVLEVEFPASLIVEFEAAPMPKIEMTELPDGTFAVKGLEIPVLHGFRGFAGWPTEDQPLMKIVVAPKGTMTSVDGESQGVHVQFDNDALIRHELGHVGARLAGLVGPTWINEGIAEEFEAREMDESGALVATPLSRALRRARNYHHAHSIDNVLNWKENFTSAGTGDAQIYSMGRPLALSLLRFLQSRLEGMSVRAKLERIVAMEPSEIRALEPDWRAWLEALPKDD